MVTSRQLTDERYPFEDRCRDAAKRATEAYVEAQRRDDETLVAALRAAVRDRFDVTLSRAWMDDRNPMACISGYEHIEFRLDEVGFGPDRLMVRCRCLEPACTWKSSWGVAASDVTVGSKILAYDEHLLGAHPYRRGT